MNVLRSRTRAGLVFVSLLELSLAAREIVYPQPGPNVPRAVSQSLPVVLWHGMGDTCCNPMSMGWLADHLNATLGVYVHSINTGSGPMWQDLVGGFYGNVNDMVARVCQQLRQDDRLKDGFNFIGFSQGGQFARAVVQRCGHLGLSVRNLITLGAQHQGVVDIPDCTSANWNVTETGLCKVFMAMLGRGAYAPWVSTHIVQAQYFKDPLDMSSYYAHNPFLPDINNEIAEERKTQYADNLAALEHFVMIRFAEDITVVPRDSSWFAVYDGHKLIPLEEQELYKSDWLGLRRLNEGGRLVRAECPGFHMQFSLDWFDANIVGQYLRA